ncbi:MAG: cupin domain-containing protein [Thermoleophilia bacterium]|nr:cupin domain-containing protein [Thermoleophilia bacterium]
MAYTDAVITDWHEIEGRQRKKGHIAASWQNLTGTNSVCAGVQRISIASGYWATPLHLEGSEEEIFYVLSGTGVSVQGDGERQEAFAVGPGDCLVHLALEHAHTIGAVADDLVVLAFGQRHYASNTLLPRAGVSWFGPTWVLEGAPQDHPFAREAAVGPPTWDTLADRPPRIVNVTDVQATERGAQTETVRSVVRKLGDRAGSERTGLSHYVVQPGKLMNPPHAHAAEEEIFVVLEGSGVLMLYPAPDAAGEIEEFPLHAGCTVARPAGTRRAHALRAGADGLTLLAFGTRDPNDIVYYPRSGKIFFRGVGVIGRLEQADYWDGED